MTKKELAHKVLLKLKKENPNPKTELNYKNEYELTVAVILSAQCTDKRVNLVTKNLFAHFPNFTLLSKASLEEVFFLIKSISYPNNKSKMLIKMANTIANTYNSKLPKKREELMQISGIGQKTANVLLSVLYNYPYIAVDTHVFRVSKRIGIVKVKSNTPKKVEEDLNIVIEDNIKAKAHHWLILHGRYICLAKKPKCNKCIIIDLCKYKNKTSI